MFVVNASALKPCAKLIESTLIPSISFSLAVPKFTVTFTEVELIDFTPVGFTNSTLNSVLSVILSTVTSTGIYSNCANASFVP